MIQFKTEDFDVHIRPEQIAFLSREPFVSNYIVCLSNGVGLACTGKPTYDEMMETLTEAGHVQLPAPTGLETCVNPDFLFLTTVDVAKTTIVYPGGGRCVVDACLEDVKKALECE